MAENITIFPTGLTYSRNTKAPLEADRLFDTLELAQAYVDNIDSNAHVGLTISVTKDNIADNNGLYYIDRIADANNTTGKLSKVGAGKDIINNIEEIKNTLSVKANKFTVGNGLDYADDVVNIVVDPASNNSLSINDAGLFAPSVSVYSLDSVSDPASGYAAQYEFKKDGVVLNTINITKDQFLNSATFHAIAETGVSVKAPYLKFEWNTHNGKNVSYVPVSELVDTYLPGEAIEIKDNKISVKLSSEPHGLAFDNNALKLNLATSSNDGAMSKEDKKTLDSVKYLYKRNDYEVVSSPVGTLVDYRDKEVRIMCPYNTDWVRQQVGTGGNANIHYITFRAYAPDNATGFKEDLSKTIGDQTLYDFNGNGGGIDQYGRKYSRFWLGVASYDETSGEWTYFGKNSTILKYIGWDYSVEWYDANGVVISRDTIRINLSNEDIHSTIIPYYMSEYAKVSDVIVTSVDSTPSNGVSLSLNEDGKLAVNTNIDILADAVIAKHVVDFNAETIKTTDSIGNYESGTSVQTVLSDLDFRLSNVVTSVKAGNGVDVDLSDSNNPKISVKVVDGSALKATEDGLALSWEVLN